MIFVWNLLKTMVWLQLLYSGSAASAIFHFSEHFLLFGLVNMQFDRWKTKVSVLAKIIHMNLPKVGLKPNLSFPSLKF